MSEINQVIIPANVKADKMVSIVRLGLQTELIPLLKQLKVDGKYDIADGALTSPLVPTIDKETGEQRISSSGNPIYHMDKSIRQAIVGLNESYRLMVQGYLKSRKDAIQQPGNQPKIEA